MQLSSITGVDIGGTFTDIVSFTPSPDSPGSHVGQLSVYKVPSTPHDPAQGLLLGIQAIQAIQATHTQNDEVAQETVVVHGTTMATNALLERKGARAALITTEGFADVLAIGRQNRPALYDIMQHRPDTLIPRERRLELAERLDFRGNILLEPTPEAFESLLQQLAECEPESVAISLLYSFRNPLHEQALTARLRDRFPNLYLTLSSELLPQFREYER